jgi:hypothetical protein
MEEIDKVCTLPRDSLVNSYFSVTSSGQRFDWLLRKLLDLNRYLLILFNF